MHMYLFKGIFKQTKAVFVLPKHFAEDLMR